MTRPMEEKRFRETVEKAFEDEPRIAGPAVSDLRDEAVRARASESDLRRRLEEAREALESAERVMATHPRDWAADRRDAWLWGLILGWDDEAMNEVAAQHGWDKEEAARLRGLRAALAKTGEKK